MSDLYCLGEQGLKNTVVPVGQGYGVRKWADEAVKSGLLVEVEPTDRICTRHYALMDSDDATECLRRELYEWTGEISECKVVSVVRVPKEDNNE